jgi:hypothetical protein
MPWRDPGVQVRVAVIIMCPRQMQYQFPAQRDKSWLLHQQFFLFTHKYCRTNPWSERGHEIGYYYLIQKQAFDRLVDENMDDRLN